MAILIDSNTYYLVQGITGKEGTRAAQSMINFGAHVVAGVTPGKGGHTVEGLINSKGIKIEPIPVYSTVAEAIKKHPKINATSIYVPPKFVLSAANEAISCDIPLIHIIAENVPTQDTIKILELVRSKLKQGLHIQVIGPSSIGVMSPGKSTMGSFGGGQDELLLAPYSENVTVGKEFGGVAVLSKSGGMSLTISNMLSQEGIALSTIVGLGGDKISCTVYSDLLPKLAQDFETWAVVLIGEIGGSYEEDFAAAVIRQHFDKPVIAFISGRFAEKLPTGVSFGHAGAIVNRKFGTREGKITALKAAGVLIADNPEDIVELLKGIKR